MNASFSINSSFRPLISGALLALGLSACGGGGGGDGAPCSYDVPSPAVLLDPSQFEETAPDTFTARFDTSKGVFKVQVTRAWAPEGADRFYNLVRNGYYDEVRFFRVLSGFVSQFGIHGDPAVNSVWSTKTIPDDPVTQSNLRSYISYAKAGANTRTTQLFINLVDNNGSGTTNLDPQGFAPFGRVTEGMDVVDALYAGYGEGPPYGTGPGQIKIQNEGNAYLVCQYPLLDFILEATIQ